ncbi:MAG: ATP-binding protein [Pseudomonadota bacterium]
MKPKIIAFSGAHGTGKTTAVNHLAEFFRVNMAPDIRIGVISEIARGCPLPIYSAACSMPQEAAQAWMFAAHLQAEIDACSKCDIVISDRTLVDYIVYARHFNYYLLANAMEGLAAVAMRQIRTVVFHHIDTHDYLVDDGFRSMEREPRIRIERMLLETYRRMRIPLLDSAAEVGIPREMLFPELQDLFKDLGEWLSISAKT